MEETSPLSGESSGQESKKKRPAEINIRTFPSKEKSLEKSLIKLEVTPDCIVKRWPTDKTCSESSLSL